MTIVAYRNSAIYVIGSLTLYWVYMSDFNIETADTAMPVAPEENLAIDFFGLVGVAV